MSDRGSLVSLAIDTAKLCRQDMKDDVRAAMHGALASLKAFIADFQKTSQDAHADLLDLHKRCMRQETRMDMALSLR